MLNERVPNRICRLNVRASTRDAPALRMGITQMLNAVDYHPVGMAPSAILLIDHITEQVCEQTTALAHDTVKKNQWISQLKQKLDTLYQQAVRPHNGCISAGAKAVVFADKAQMLACLCRDVVHDSVSQHWWWKNTYTSVFLNSTVSSALRSSLSSGPGVLPAVMHSLAQWHLAIDLVKKLDDDDAEYLVGVVLNAFSCRSLFEKLSRAQDHSVTAANGLQSDVNNTSLGDAPVESTEQDTGVPTTLTNRFQRQYSTAAISSVYPPWITMFSEQIWEQRLSKAQACLLGVTRLAHSAPILLRNRIFESQIVNWMQQPELTGLHGSPIERDLHASENKTVEVPSHWSAPSEQDLSVLRNSYQDRKNQESDHNASPTSSTITSINEFTPV